MPANPHHYVPLKSQAVALLLTFFFGPLGMFYATVSGAIIMMIITFVVGTLTLGLGLILTWPICIVWAYTAVGVYNQRLQQQAQAATAFVPSKPAEQPAPKYTYTEEVEVSPTPPTEPLTTDYSAYAPPASTHIYTKAEIYSHLEQLGELKSKGILTEEEFTAQKAILLAMLHPV